VGPTAPVLFSFLLFSAEKFDNFYKNAEKSQKCKLNFVKFLKSRSSVEKYSCMKNVTFAPA